MQSLDLLGLLQEQLASKTPEVRSEAAFAYGQVKGASSAALIVRLAVEKDEAVRVQLVAALGRLGGPSDVTQLVFQATGMSRGSGPQPWLRSRKLLIAPQYLSRASMRSGTGFLGITIDQCASWVGILGNARS